MFLSFNTSTTLLRLLLCYVMLLNFLNSIAQDSLKHHVKLHLFDLNIRLGFGSSGSVHPSLETVSSYTKHKDYVSGAFVSGYSDTVRNGHLREWFAPNVAGEVGFGTSFKFQTQTNKLLERIKPRFGLYHSSLNLFRYEMGIEKHYVTDTLHFVNPNYPPILIDSSIIGNITYNYKSKRMYAEAGVCADIVVTKAFTLYTGFIYGYGIGYNNTFRVTKTEEGQFIDETFRESTSFSHRFIFPLGMHVRFGTRKKIAPGFLAELRVGSDLNRVHTQLLPAGVFFNLNIGFRLYLQHFK